MGTWKTALWDGSKPIMRCFREMHHPKTMLFCLGTKKQDIERGFDPKPSQYANCLIEN